MKKTANKLKLFSLEKKILGKILKPLSKINRLRKSLERGYEMDDILTDSPTLNKIIYHLTSNGFSKQTATKVIDSLRLDLKDYFAEKPHLRKAKYTREELESIKKHVEKLRDLFISHDDKKLFRTLKTLGAGTNDKWLDYLDEMLTAVRKEKKKINLRRRKSKKGKGMKIKEIEYLACLVGTHLEDINARLKPTSYYNEAKERLGLGGELIFLIFKFYDRRITRSSIRGALKNYKQTSKEIRQKDLIFRR